MSPSDPELPRLRLRWATAFVLALVGFLSIVVVSGQAPVDPSPNNHFTHQASAWLEGELALPGDPPGYCSAELRRAKKCRHHSYDDWAVVWRLQLRDGQTVRGYPCKRADCRKTRREGETWLLTDGTERTLPRGSIVARDRTWYVSFPPGPAALMLPLVAVFGLDAPDRIVTAVLGALSVLAFLVFLDLRRGPRREHTLAAIALALASPLTLLATNSSVWFTAQVMATLGIIVYLHAAWDTRRPALAGWALAFACTARPHVGFAAVLFLDQWRRSGRDTHALIRFLGPLAIVGFLMASMNVARFDQGLEFGHRYLDIRWQTRIQETGLFSFQYLPRNLQCMLWLLPISATSAPFFRLSLHGTAIWVVAPWLAMTFAGRRRFDQRNAAWLAAALVAVVPLLYQNSGQLQTTYRFGMEWIPLVLATTVFSGGARRRAFAVLVAFGAVFSIVSATLFAADPGSIFVAEPLGWPFQDELR